jgi:WD40 repeat protein
VDYDAFISYAYEPDDRLASALRDGLGHYAKHWWQRRALHIFQDRSSLAANPGLWSSIADGIDQSEWFILLASPDSARSYWVNRELSHFLSTRGPERLLLVPTAGTLAWDKEANAFTARSDAVPEALLGCHTEEPRYSDLRWARDETLLHLRNPRFRDAVAEIAAPIRGLSKDELEDVDLREHRRTRRTIIATVAVLVFLLLAAITTATAAFVFARNASARTADAGFARLVLQARDLKTSNQSLAMLLAVQATRLRDNSQSEGALLATLTQDPRFNGEIVQSSERTGFQNACLLAGGRFAIGGRVDGGVVLLDLARGVAVDRVPSFDRSSSPTRVACDPSHSRAVAYDEHGDWAVLHLGQRLSLQGETYHLPGLYAVALSSDGRTVALSDSTGDVFVQKTGMAAPGFEVVTRAHQPGNDHGLGLAFSPDGHTLVSGDSAVVDLWTVSDTDALIKFSEFVPPPLAAISATPRLPLLRQEADQGEVEFSPDGRFVAVSADSLLFLIDAATGQELWARPTAWYAGSVVHFTPSGQLWVNMSAGEIEQVSLADGHSVGQPIDPMGGIAVGFSISKTRLVASSATSPLLSVYDVEGNGPITHAISSSDPAVIEEFDPSSRYLLTQVPGISGPIFNTTRAYDIRAGRWGPQLPPMVQPRFVAPALVGGLGGTGKIGEIDVRTGSQIGRAISVDFAESTNAQYEIKHHQFVLANIGGDIDLYNDITGAMHKEWARVPGTYPILSSDGFSVNGDIAVLDTAFHRVWVLNHSGQVVLRKHIDATTAALSPNGRVLAVLNGVQLDLFDVGTGEALGNIDVPIGSVDLEFSADGKLVLAFGQSVGLVVDLSTKQALGDPFSSNGYVALRPDGRQLATETAEGNILLWDLDPHRWEEAACQAAGRNLTPTEWREYLSDVGSYQRTCPQWP